MHEFVFVKSAEKNSPFQCVRSFRGEANVDDSRLGSPSLVDIRLGRMKTSGEVEGDVGDNVVELVDIAVRIICGTMGRNTKRNVSLKNSQ